MLRFSMLLIVLILTACVGGGGGSSGGQPPTPPLPSTALQVNSAVVSGDLDPALDLLRSAGRAELRVDGVAVPVDADHHWEVTLPAATASSALLELLVDGSVVDARLIDVAR